MSCDLNLTEDQRQIIDAADALLNEHFPLSRLRGGYAPDPLEEIAAFGGFALGLPEDIGGTGFTIVEEALMHVRFGRHAVATASLAVPIAARLADEIGNAELASRIATGEATVCAGMNAEGSILLSDQASADLALIWGTDSLKLINIANLDRDPEVALGHGRPLARVIADDQSLIGESISSPLVRTADLLVSAQLLGIAEAVRDMAVDYAQTREQFGQPIGMFQAIKHHAANMAIGAEKLSAFLDMAAIAVRDGREDAAFQVTALRRLAPKIALANARTAIQIHGGMGFSAETDVHHFLKLAHVLSRLGGGADLLELSAPLAPFAQN